MNIFNKKSFLQIDNEEGYGIKKIDATILILPYINDENGLPLKIGVVREKNQFREGGYAENIISTEVDSENPDMLQYSKDHINNLLGVNIEDNKKWFFLGSVTASKYIDSEYPCFAVDLTEDIENIKNSENYKNKLFRMIPANDVVKAKDVFIPAMFLKLFKFVVGMDLYHRYDSTFSKSDDNQTDI